MFNQNEHRSFHRMAVNCPIKYKKTGSRTTRLGSAINLSSTGILFRADESPLINSELEIDIEPGTASITPLSMTVKVLRVSPASTEGQFEVAGVIQAKH